MRDIGPEGLVPLHEVEGRPEAFGLHAHPERVDVLGGQLAAATGVVQLAFEVVEGDLPHDGVDHVLDLAGQQHLALGPGLGAVQQLAEGQHLAEDRGGLGQGQRRRGEHLALIRGQHLVHAVAQLMREGHHVARLAEIVEQDIGMHLGHRGMGEGARRLAGLHAGVDPALAEERSGDLGHARIEGGIGLHHRRLGLSPGHDPGVLHRQRRVAVPDLHPVEAEPLALELVIAVAEPRIGRDHGAAQRLDHLGLDIVGKVPGGLRGGHLAPTVDDLLFLGLGVVDAGEGLDVLAEDPRQFTRRGLALGAVLLGQKVQRALDGQGLALHLEFQPGDGLVEQPLPGVADDAEIVQELLQLVAQLVGLHRSDAVEDRLVARQIGIGGEMRGQHRIVEPVQLEREEDQRGGGVGDLLLAVGEELGALGIGGLLVIAQPGEGHDAPGDG